MDQYPTTGCTLTPFCHSYCFLEVGTEILNIRLWKVFVLQGVNIGYPHYLTVVWPSQLYKYSNPSVYEQSVYEFSLV
jgi:hypothetical protein